MNQPESLKSPRTEIRRRSQRGHYDPETIYRIIDEAVICHIGFYTDGYVTVLPTAHWRHGNRLYVHGAPGSRMMQAVAGQDACVSITIVDGLVLARSAFHHSMNYRSVVIMGKGKLVESLEEKQESFYHFMEKIAPGRWQEVRRPDDKELNATTLLYYDITEASAKVRTGPPIDDEKDLGVPVWAGVVPLKLRKETPIPAPELSPMAVPKYTLQNE